MGIFDGLLLCSDIDGTLICDDHSVSEDNLRAIDFFKKEGGIFTLASGRVPSSIGLFIDKIKPNAPVICQNGGAIYDFDVKDYLWFLPLEEEAKEVVEYVMREFDFCGIEIICKNDVFFVRENQSTMDHMHMEFFPHKKKQYEDIKEPWLKILFAQEAEQTNMLKSAMKQTDFSQKYKLVKSHPNYFEVLNKDVNKGLALSKLADILKVPIENTIAIGDNDNDVEMLETAGLSAAVATASHRAMEKAAIVTKDNNHGAIADIINKLLEMKS